MLQTRLLPQSRAFTCLSSHGQLQSSVHHQHLARHVRRLQEEEDGMRHLVRLAEPPQRDGAQHGLILQRRRHVRADKAWRQQRAAQGRERGSRQCRSRREQPGVAAPGASRLTLTFRDATSLARECVKPSRPALLALYTHWPEFPLIPTTEPGKQTAGAISAADVFKCTRNLQVDAGRTITPIRPNRYGL